MSHFILVHGAWEESGMWDNVAPILEQNGHTVTAVDLPGHGANRQEGLQVTTERLQFYSGRYSIATVL